MGRSGIDELLYRFSISALLDGDEVLAEARAWLDAQRR
jgi:hypothetical protein